MKADQHVAPTSQQSFTIDIRPTTSVYATYQRLSYKTWFAIAEFVDNSTASYWNHREQLLNAYEQTSARPRCRVKIGYDSVARRLTIDDNAFGMELADFRRALVLDQPPASPSGRNEFGMGLKTAACWFGTRWTVETTQLGSPHLYRATIDIRDLASTKREAIEYTVTPVPPSSHGTMIIIEDVQQPIVGRAHERVREQLRSIYRNDLRSGEVEILYQGESLTYQEPDLLKEESVDGIKEWKQEVSFGVPWERLGVVLPVTGWLGIRKKMSRRDSGFVLMRHGRVIVGGPEQGYRPGGICGPPQTQAYARIVGELNLDHWPVNQAKDGFSWNDGLEDAFIEALAAAGKDVVRKARSHRVDQPANFSGSTKVPVAPGHKAGKTDTPVLISQPTGRRAPERVPQPEETAKSVQLSRPETQSSVARGTQQEFPRPADESYGNLDGVVSLQGEPGRASNWAAQHYPLVVPEEGRPFSPTIQPQPLSPLDTNGHSPEAPQADIPSSDTSKVGNRTTYKLDVGQDTWLLVIHWRESHREQCWMSLQPPRPSHEGELEQAQVIEVTLNAAHPFLASYLGNPKGLEALQRFACGVALSETLIRAQIGDARVDPGTMRVKLSEILKCFVDEGVLDR